MAVAAVRRLLADDGLMLADHMPYMALLILFPFLIFLASLASFLGDAVSAAGAAFPAGADPAR